MFQSETLNPKGSFLFYQISVYSCYFGYSIFSVGTLYKIIRSKLKKIMQYFNSIGMNHTFNLKNTENTFLVTIFFISI